MALFASCFVFLGCGDAADSAADNNDGKGADGGGGAGAEGGGGAGAEGAGGGQGGTPQDVCSEQANESTTDNFAVVRCIQQHESPPHVRLPADVTTGGETTAYGGFDPGSREIMLRDQVIALSDEEFALLDGEGASSVGDRYAYALYRFTFDGDGKLKNYAPAVLVDDAVFLDVTLAGRRFEGLISEKTAEDEFDIEPKIPIAITFSDVVVAGKEADPFHGYPIATVEATVDNFDTKASLDDGTCAAALTSIGAANPLSDATPLGFFRVPNMHGAFDDVVVVVWNDGTSNMGSGLYVPPVALMSDEPVGTTEYSSSPHGVPWGAPSLTLAESSKAPVACQ